MPQHSDEHGLLIRYFLGVASATEREEIEARYFASDSEIETLLRAEDEVIDDYVRGALNTSERVLFEENFLCTPARRQRLEFTESLVETLAGTEQSDSSTANQDSRAHLPLDTNRFPGQVKTDEPPIIQGRLALDLRPELFDSLLGWLDPVRDRAAEKYEKIRTSLVRLFASRGCIDADELADETINRVASRVTQLMETYVGDPASYFSRVAHYVLLESSRASARGPMLRELMVEQAGSGDEQEQAQICLQKCLEQLSEENRELILQYYGPEKPGKIGNRKELAQNLGISISGLRIRVHRIRTSLQKCVTACLEEANDLT